ncbi:MAG TPA: hypothetical protein VIK74_09925 [Parasegetibacter sp.]
MKMNEVRKHPASYKDPAGFIFSLDGKIYRQVNKEYASHYDHLMNSGLYQKLVNSGLILPHIETNLPFADRDNGYKILEPETLTFVSYPAEWSFDMLRDAALLTLKVNLTAIEYEMVLKDATPFNVQVHQGKMVFIDTLSFEKYDESKPWVAFRQFCECFLSPLFLSHYNSAELIKLLSVYIDGIPAGLTAKLLPFRSRFSLAAWLYFYLPGMVNNNQGNKPQTNGGFNKQKLQRLLQHLTTTVERLKCRNENTVWDNYYQETILGKEYLEEKEKIFRSYIDVISFENAVDLGANDGHFSRILSSKSRVVAVDFDHNCINRLYNQAKKSAVSNLIPLVVDLSNPTSAVGFANTERQSFIERCKPDLLLALALIHHLVFGKNIPLSNIAKLLSMMTSKYLIIEFVPFEDIKVQELVKNKDNFHRNYSQEEFESLFGHYFLISRKEKIKGTDRWLYCMSKK